ncbi:penicillin-binding protein 1C [Sulfitobacter sp. JBTF-M27]|uniref:peptidoglycan glycosyltransferase n=1 Tax=Sulfitobacter sediminilitoris TaxID=2698830 RepID=A0A6P0C6A0_9RHOB|nr:penicillin-binding protein 1C [Sulfitobacter sediminilitoris]NEK21367.1 penicillin-binding protein 1C [Sulfitobacter sediminilitoris]
MIRRYALFGLVLALGLGAGLRDAFDGWVAGTKVPPVLVETSVEVRDRHGTLMRVFPVEDGRIRLAPDLDQVDPDFLSMLITYEDKRFYTHSGVDPLAALRAAVQAIWAGEVVSGGSTLTMQVARLLENSGTGRLAGKLRQVRLALALERRLSKAQILELYLAHAPYGGPVEGLRAGSLAWFGKEPKRLSMNEAALLVALPQAPEARRPDRYPDIAQAARARVLDRVNAPEDLRAAPVPAAMRPFARLAPHLADQMRRQSPLSQRHDVTLDAGLQKQIAELAAQAVRGQPQGVSAAIVAADHQSGEVLASVGSPAYAATGGRLGFVDMTRAVRSPGSTLKPFIYALAFDQGLAHPDTLIDDVPVSFGRYAPQNFDGQFRGQLTLRKALQLSLNIPPVLLMQELGPARLLATLRKGGAQPQVPGGQAGLAVALGGVGLTLNDLVQLYGGLANGGEVRPLSWRTGQANQSSHRIVSRSAAWQVGHILASISAPQGSAADARHIAFKTGTSYGHRDAWAIGFDGAHVIGVWLGRPDGTPVPGAFGGDLAAPVLFEAFGRLKARAAPLPPPPPETLILSTAALPKPLQRFRSRDAVFAPARDAPQVSFPPDGAVLRMTGEPVPLKLSAGVLPLTVLVDGAPVLTNLRHRDALLPMTGPGFSRISVIDAKGRAASVQIRLQ